MHILLWDSHLCFLLMYPALNVPWHSWHVPPWRWDWEWVLPGSFYRLRTVPPQKNLPRTRWTRAASPGMSTPPLPSCLHWLLWRDHEAPRISLNEARRIGFSRQITNLFILSLVGLESNGHFISRALSSVREAKGERESVRNEENRSLSSHP